jgi:hypothetical protein
MGSCVVGKEEILVYQFCVFEGVDFDYVSFSLPMCGEHNDCFGFHFLCDFSADFLELGVDWVIGFVHDIWLFNVLVFGVCWKGAKGLRLHG